MKKREAQWKKLKMGLFIHLGVYSVFGGVYNNKRIETGYSEQIMQFAPIPRKDYLEGARELTLEHFNPKEIISLAKKAGCNYLVITSKHHDGFCMFKTRTTDFNIVEKTPYGKDLLKELSEVCREENYKFGVYFSLVDWNLGHDYDPDNWNTIPKIIEEKLAQQLTELMTGYGDICEVWFDMSRPTKEQSKRFKEIVRKYQPMAMINGRLGNDEGDFKTFWDNEIPTTAPEGPWQTPQSIYPDTWGYRSWQAHEEPIVRAEVLRKNRDSVISRGGNYLLNIGPKGDGSVTDFEKEVLLALGDNR